MSTRDPKEASAFDRIQGSLLVKPFDPPRLVSLVQYHARMSGMSSVVRRLADASAMRRLKDKE